MRKYLSIFAGIFTLSSLALDVDSAGLREGADGSYPQETMGDYSNIDPALDPETRELMRAKQQLRSTQSNTSNDSYVLTRKKKRKAKRTRRIDEAQAFVAGADWEFDGFVVGGQDQDVKSMFVVNDLVYINVGYLQGLEPGDKVNIFKRGDKIRDPQTGRFIGYEIRHAAVSEVTNRVEEEVCSVRIIQIYESVEVGDLIRQTS